jgi:hypothetical protein
MRKLKLSPDDIRVGSFPIDAAAFHAGTVLGNQTQPDSGNLNPCTGSACTYPIHFCHPRIEADDKKKQQR